MDVVVSDRVRKIISDVDNLIEEILRSEKISNEDIVVFFMKYKEIVSCIEVLEEENLSPIDRGVLIGKNHQLNTVFMIIKIVDAYFKGHFESG